MASYSKDDLNSSVNVFTWNILTRAYFNNETFPEYDNQIFDNERRIEQIISILTNQFEKNAIIALQEVDITTWEQILPVFHNNQYQAFIAHYGNVDTDYMGVVLAWPGLTYKLKTWLQTIPNDKISQLQPSGYNLEFKSNPFLQAGRSWKWLIAAELYDPVSKQHFVVSTYHMPNFYWIPDALYMSTDVAFSSLERYLEQQQIDTLPVIFMGDFNIIDGDINYQLITSDSQDKRVLTLHNDNESDQLNLGRQYFYRPTMKHRYLSYLQPVEGAYTTRTKHKALYGKESKIFSEVIDYIWLRNVPEQTLLNTMTDDVLYPTIDMPSDHLPLQATIYL